MTHSTSKEFLGHPRGLYVCFATELWERFSFYGMKFLLLLYLTKYHLFSDAQGYDVLGAYAGLVYTLPLLGGYLADRFLGMRKAVLFGGVLLTAGHATMAYEGQQATLYAAGTQLASPLTLNDGTLLAAGTVLDNNIVIQDSVALNVFFLALALITLGVGFLKPNISAIVGRLYTQNDPRRDAGYTIYYMGINIGAFVAINLCGWLGETFGWRYGFGAAGVGMLCGLITFVLGQPYLKGTAEPPSTDSLRRRVLGVVSVEWAIYLGSLLSISLLWYLMQHERIVHIAQNNLLIVSIVGLILYSLHYQQERQAKSQMPFLLAGASVFCGLIWAWTGAELGLGLMLIALIAFIAYGFRYHNSVAYSRTVVLMFLILSSVVFWALFEQSAGSMTLYADRVVDRTIGQHDIAASRFGALNAAFIILLALPLAYAWTWLGRRNLEPSTPVKFGLAIIQAGLGFGALVLGAMFPNESGKVAMSWLVLAYLLHTTGELFLSPVGLSAVSKLSIPHVLGVSMGTWFLATALSETISTRIGKLAAVDPSEANAADLVTMLDTYTGLYTTLTWVGIATGIVILALSPWLKKGMRGVR